MNKFKIEEKEITKEDILSLTTVTIDTDIFKFIDYKKRSAECSSAERFSLYSRYSRQKKSARDGAAAVSVPSMAS